MKRIPGLTLAAMLATGAMAQTPPTLPAPGTPGVTTPATPAPQSPAEVTPAVTNKPAAKPASTKKKTTTKKATTTAKKPAAASAGILPAVPLVVNEPAVARQNNINIRGQAKINSEIVARLKEGETVTVLEEITLPHPKQDEPAKWAKISMPERVHVFVNTAFLDTNKTVKPAKLNVRSGPGENFSVVGMLHKGDAVKETGTKGDWSEIEAPSGSYAFVAAHLLTHKTAEAPVAPPPVVAPPTPAEVASAPTIAAPPTGAPTNNTPEPTSPVAAPPVATPQVPEPLPPPVEEPPGPRIVQREGIVRGTVSIQAPSYFELESLDTGKVIDYLYTSSTNVALKRWKGKTVLVTGEEGLDERWPNTPVITIQKIQLVQ